MPKQAKELKDLQVRRLTCSISTETGKPCKTLHAVGGIPGLLLQITPTGARSWILRTMVNNKRRDIGLGPYPEIPLKSAREKARQLKELIRQGIDPIKEKREAKKIFAAQEASKITFKEAAEAFIDMKSKEFRGPRQKALWLASMRNHVFPVLGHILVSEIQRQHIETILDPIWHTITTTAETVRRRTASVLDWCQVKGYMKGQNPARWAGNLKELYPAPSKFKEVKHFDSLPYKDLPKFMANLNLREGVAARALEFSILTASRSNEVIGDKRIGKPGISWSEIDLESKVWTIPAKRMKSKKSHRVPLTDKAISLLESMQVEDNTSLIFPNTKGGLPSDNFMRSLLKRMDIEATPHGFRTTFKEWARAETNYPDEQSELALSHVNSDQTRAAYARSELIEPRRKLMKEWEGFCYKKCEQH